MSTDFPGVKIFTPSEGDELDHLVKKIVDDIKPRERYHVVIPRKLSHYKWREKEVTNWNCLEDILGDVPYLKNFSTDTFIALRYDKECSDQEATFILDFYRC